MRLKPKKTTLNVRATLYKRFTAVLTAIPENTAYLSSDGKTWLFAPKESLKTAVECFVEIENSEKAENVVKIEDGTALSYKGLSGTAIYTYNSTVGEWEDGTASTTTLAQFGNIGKYQVNKYYYSGEFDFIIRGDIEGDTAQYLKGGIIPLTSLAIKHYDDTINLCPDDLVVIDGHLYSVENPSISHIHLPKDYRVYYATLNSIK